MLAYEDEDARSVFAVYLRPEGDTATINFYNSEAEALADVGPGMPEGVLTHGDTYIEYIGEALLFAPANWSLHGVDQDSLIQLATDDFEIFVALAPAESKALLNLVGQDFDITASAPPAIPPVAVELIPAPVGITSSEPFAVWESDGDIVLFGSGSALGGEVIGSIEPRPDFDDEVGTDRAVVALLDTDWIPLASDDHTWSELGEPGEPWVINLQRRAHESEQFFARYTADDKTLVVARSAVDTAFDEEHVQLVAEGLGCDFPHLIRCLKDEGWTIDTESNAAAEFSVHPELSESPGWYPAEADSGIEWLAAIYR